MGKFFKIMSIHILVLCSLETQISVAGSDCRAVSVYRLLGSQWLPVTRILWGGRIPEFRALA